MISVAESPLGRDRYIIVQYKYSLYK